MSGDGGEFGLVPSVHLATSTERIIDEIAIVTPKCLVYSNFVDLNPHFARAHMNGLYVDRQRQLAPITLCRMDGSARLAVPDDEDFIPLSGNRVIAEQVRPHWTGTDIAAAMSNAKCDDEIGGPVVLVARYGIRTWGHWLGELLPKIIAVEAHSPGRYRYLLPDILFRDPEHRAWVQTLEYYGISADRMALVSAGVCYRVAQMHLVTPVWSGDPPMIHPAAAELMRRSAPAPAATGRGPQRVALLRRTDSTRNIANIRDVEELLVCRGWALVDIEQLTFSQQVAVFRDAAAIVSVLGSGLTGLIYAPKGVKVIALAPSHWGDAFFFALVQEREAPFADIRGTSLAGNPHDPQQAWKSSFHVPLAQLEAGLAALDLADAIPSFPAK